MNYDSQWVIGRKREKHNSSWYVLAVITLCELCVIRFIVSRIESYPKRHFCVTVAIIWMMENIIMYFVIKAVLRLWSHTNVSQRVVSPTIVSQTSLVSSQTFRSQFANVTNIYMSTCVLTIQFRILMLCVNYWSEISRYKHLHVNLGLTIRFNILHYLHVVCVHFWMWNLTAYFPLKYIS